MICGQGINITHSQWNVASGWTVRCADNVHVKDVSRDELARWRVFWKAEENEAEVTHFLQTARAKKSCFSFPLLEQATATCVLLCYQLIFLMGASSWGWNHLLKCMCLLPLGMLYVCSCSKVWVSPRLLFSMSVLYGCLGHTRASKIPVGAYNAALKLNF